MTAPAGPALPRGLVILLGTGAAVIVVAGMRAAAWLIAPILLALVIVIVISPVHRWLRRNGVHAWVATSALVVLVYGALLAFLIVMVVAVVRLAELLPQYSDRMRGQLTRAGEAMSRWGLEPDQIRQAVSSLDLGRLLSRLGALLGDLTGVTTSVVFLLALLLFFSVETSGIDARLADIARDRPQLHRALNDFARRTRRYLVVTTIFGFIVAVLDTIALAWLGIPLAVLWGLLSFVTNYIPNIGFILGVVPPALLALLGDGWRRMLLVIVVYLVINFVGQSLIQPRYVGDAVGLSTVLTFVSLVFWSWVLGPLGVLLAIPATLLVMALLVDVDPRAGWAAALLRAPVRHKRAVRTRWSSVPGDALGSKRGVRSGKPSEGRKPMATLTIWRFGSAEGAHRAARTLAQLAKGELITVHDAAVVSWNEGSRKPKLRQLHNLAGRGALSGGLWGMLFGLIFFIPLIGAAAGAAAGALGGALTDVGIDDDLIRQVRDQVTPGTSALFVLSSDAVIDKVRDAFTGLDEPELMFTNLSPEQETALREMFTAEWEPERVGGEQRQPSS